MYERENETRGVGFVKHIVLFFIYFLFQTTEDSQWCRKHVLPFECLPVAVIVELVVGGESDKTSPGGRQREEDLSGRVLPHLRHRRRRRRTWSDRQTDSRTGGQTDGQTVGLFHLCIVQLLPLWGDEVENAVKGTREGHSSDQEDDQHHVGEGGGEVNHLE